MGINRDTVIRYLHYLERAKLLSLVQAAGKGVSKMSKPTKIYLENPNLMTSLNAEKMNQGNLRETFL